MLQFRAEAFRFVLNLATRGTSAVKRLEPVLWEDAEVEFDNPEA